MNYITPASSTQFPVGSKVKITNKGHAYTTYKDMARYLKIEDKFKWGDNPFKEGDIGVVVARATHENSSYGEVFAVKVGDEVGMIGYRGLIEYEEPIVIGKPKLANYDLAPLTPEALPRLAPYFAKAPNWATHVGSDEKGVHFFDHQPMKFSNKTFLKGLLPDTPCQGYEGWC